MSNCCTSAKYGASSSRPLSRLNDRFDGPLPTSSRTSIRWRRELVAATKRPPGRSTRTISEKRTIEIRHVVEHPRRNDAVELAVGERQLLHVCDPRVDPALPAPARPSAARDRPRRPPPPSRARSTPPARPSRSRPRARAPGAPPPPPPRAAHARRRRVATPVYAAARLRNRVSSAYSDATSAGSSSRVKSRETRCLARHAPPACRRATR